MTKKISIALIIILNTVLNVCVFDVASNQRALHNKNKHLSTPSLRHTSPLIIGLQKDQAPLSSLNESNQPIGFLVDYWRLWSQKTDIPIAFYVDTKNKLIKDLKNKKCDIIAGIAKRRLFGSDLSFSPSIIPVGSNLFYLHDQPIGHLDNLEGEKIGVLSNSSEFKEIPNLYPNISLTQFSSYSDMIFALLTNQISAFIGKSIIVSNLLQRKQQIGRIDWIRKPIFFDNLKAAVNKSETKILEVISEGMASITPDEIIAIESRWIPNRSMRLYTNSGKALLLTETEKKWLKNHKLIRLGVDPKWPPFETINNKNNYEGISSDYIKHISKQLKISMLPVKKLTWSEVIKKTKQGKIDVLPCVFKTPERSQYLLFTEPYIKFPIVIVTSVKTSFVMSLQDLKGMKIVVPDQYATIDILAEELPNQKIETVPDAAFGLTLVSEGNADAYVGNLATITFLTRKLGLKNIKVAASTPYTFDLAMGVRKDWPQLVTILNKGIHTVSSSRHNKIVNHWLNVRFTPKMNWLLFWKILLAVVAFISIFMFLIIFWNRKLSREVSQRKKAEERFNNMAANVPGAIFQLLIPPNEKPRIEYVSPGAELFFQASPKEIVEKQLKLPIHPDDEERIKSTFKKSLRKNKGWNLVGRLNFTLNGPFWFRASASPITTQNGGIIFNGFLLDITKRKQAEEEYLKSERKMEAMSKAVGDALIMLDRNAKIQFWNKGAQRLFGYDSSEILQKSITDLFPLEKDKNSINDLIEKCKVTYGFSKQTLLSEHTCQNKSGEKIPVESNFSSFLIDEKLYFITLIRDLTERKTAQEAINDQLAFQKALLDTIPNPIFVKDPQGKYVDCNQAYVEAFGIEREAMIGKTVLEISHLSPKDRAALHAQDNTLLKEGGLSYTQKDFLFADQKPHTVLFWKTTFNLANGSLGGLVGILVDISSQKKIEKQLDQAKKEAEAATMAKGNFLANMSHEIRTPMNAIIGLNHLALQTELTPQQKNYVKKTLSSAESLLQIINDILDFSKIEAGKLKMEKISFNLDEVLQNVGNLISLKAQEKDLELLLNIPMNIPQKLVGDPLRLSQVLSNLANNAVKFTEQGEIIIDSELIEQNDKNIYLKFSVKDTGIGMTKEETQKLFTAFTQADTSTTRKYGGTGLGLTICKRLVDLMDGNISVTSQKGKGSVFEFTAVFNSPKEEKETYKKPSTQLGELKILIVDDNRTSRKIFQTTLRSMGFNTQVAESGARAVEKVKQANSITPFDLCLMDWKMPGMNGLEASRIIKQDKNLKQKPAIILVTAFSKENLEQKAHDLGLEGFLLKPVSPSSLLDAIMDVFGPESLKKPIKEVSFSNHKFNGQHILVAEDNLINQQVAQELLQSVNLKVSVAADGQKALELLKNESFDAVLMDIQMPNMDGLTATRKIRKLPQFKNMPIIAMTANAMAQDRKDCLEAGMDDHVAKPIEPDLLYRVLKKWLKKEDQKRLSSDQKAPQPTSKTDQRQKDDFWNDTVSIDTKKGLARIGGSKTLYKELLVMFIQDYHKAPGQMAELLSKKQIGKAKIQAHTIKGVAGTIGAQKLFEKAEVLENQLTDKTTQNYNNSFEEFNIALNEVLEELEPLEPYLKPKTSQTPKQQASNKDLLASLEKIKEPLRLKKPKIYKQALEEIIQLNWPDNFINDIKKLEKRAKSYKFKEALELLNLLIEKLKNQ